MSMVISEGGGKSTFEMAPEGTTVGICYQIIDLGTQKTNWDGEESAKRKVQLGWELPNEKMSDGRPFVVQKPYTLSLHEKSSLRKDLEAWRGRAFTAVELKGFDIAKLLGKACTLAITHTHKENGKTYANVKSVSGLIKGTSVPDLANKPVQLSLNPKEFNKDVYDGLSDYLRGKIAMSPEFIECMHDPRLDDPHREEDSDVDF